ncbi:hypothetical protein B0H13DRAFT_2322878 [Mycena leptocephala]|nr:hypothetical protein B0H13DRAFT_2322878 [Mycena leptocephala]
MHDPLLTLLTFLPRRRDTHALAFPLYLAPIAPYAVRYPATVSVSISISHPGLLTPRVHCLLPQASAARPLSLLLCFAEPEGIPFHLSKPWLLSGFCLVLVWIWPLHCVFTSPDSIRS